MQPASDTSTETAWAWATTRTSHRCLIAYRQWQEQVQPTGMGCLPAAEHHQNYPDNGFQCTENNYLEVLHMDDTGLTNANACPKTNNANAAMPTTALALTRVHTEHFTMGISNNFTSAQTIDLEDSFNDADDHE